MNLNVLIITKKNVGMFIDSVTRLNHLGSWIKHEACCLATQSSREDQTEAQCTVTETIF